MKHAAILGVLTVLSLTGSAKAQQCPEMPPRNADVQDFICRYKDANSRCVQPLSEDDCNLTNDEALKLQLITPAAREWLWNNFQCAMVFAGKIQSICPEGCFEASTQILVTDTGGSFAEKPAERITKDDRLASVVAESSLEEPRLEGRAIEQLVSGAERGQLYVFSMSNGRELKVTEEHAMVVADGRVVPAHQVEKGDEFLDANGEPVEVQKISMQSTKERVYNFRVDTNAPQEHVIVAEGVLVGDLTLQNELARERASIEQRR